MRGAALLLATACSTAAPAELVSGDVVSVREVVKGDEVVVEKGGRQAKVRILGIHAFEAVIDDAALKGLATAGIERIRELTKGRQLKVTLADRAKDAHGRYLAYLDVGTDDVGKQVVADGLAIVYTEYPFARELDYLTVETGARSKRAHAWGDVTSEKMIRGLRREWAEARTQRSGKPGHDPLLTP